MMRIFTHSKTNIHISKVRIRTFVLGIIFSLFGGTLYANPIHPTSTVHSRNAFYSPSTTSAMGSAEVIQHTAPAYKMANTSAFKMASTYAPAQTVYAPFSDENPSNSGPSRISGRKNGDDDIMYKALKIVLLEGHTSTSYLQRNLKISYNRAAELLETMEARKIVSKLYGNGTREVLIKRKTTRRRKYSGE
jgi:DNA segregation ATPase FtsK/SpoIIIE-like protein